MRKPPAPDTENKTNVKEDVGKTLNRTQTAIEYLHSMAREAGAGAKLPTFNELMQQTGVSKATLSAALSHLEASRIVQRKHGVGIFVSKSLNHASFAIVFDPRFFRYKGVSPFWHLMWNALADVARQRAVTRNDSFSFHLAPLETSPEAPLSDDLCDAVNAGRVHGVLAVGLCEDAANFLTNACVPLVSHAGAGHCQIDTDSSTLVRIGTEHLIRQGCKTLALWNPGDPFNDPLAVVNSSINSFQTFTDVLNEHHLNIHAELIFDANLRAAFSGQPVLDTRQGQGYAIATKIFGSKNGIKPDGIMVQDDMLAQGALTAMEKLGVRAGRDVEFVSHSNKGSTILQGYEENITRIEYDPHEIAELMFERLDEILSQTSAKAGKAGHDDENYNRRILVAPRLVLS